MRLFSTWAAASAIADPLVWTEASILQAVAQAECRVLATPLDDLLGRLTALGSQRILVANPVGTLAQAGRFSWASPQGHIGHLHARDVDIDLDLQSAATVLATGVGRRSVLPLGVRVYNSAGDLLLSLTPDSHIGSQAFHEVVRAHFIKVSERPSPPSTTAHPQRSRTTHLAVDIDGAMVAWSRSSTHHSLDAILEQHGVSRQQFYNTVPGAVASPIEADQMLALLRWTVSKRAPMLLQVGRAGAATVTRLFPTAVETTHGSIDLVGPRALLRLDRARLDQAWVVSLDTAKGRMRRIEILDASGDLAVCLGPTALGRAAAVSRWSGAARPGRC